MTNPAYTHYILIIDRSGSMDSIKDDTQGGIRDFAKEQEKLPGKQTLSLYQFDDHFETVTFYGKMSEAIGYRLRPRGLTALWGAVGTAIDNEGEKLAALAEDDRPDKVIVVIATDGQENHSAFEEWSRQYTVAKVKEMITHQQDVYNWKFTYIGANQDSFKEAGKIGIAAAATMDYAPSSRGTKGAWRGVTVNTANYASGQSLDIAYSQADRKESLKGDEDD